jgi:hypothetical protein
MVLSRNFQVSKIFSIYGLGVAMVKSIQLLVGEMDWCKGKSGKSTGNRIFPIKYGSFPVNVPLNQSIS